MKIQIIEANDNVVTEAIVTGFADSPQAALSRGASAIYAAEQREGMVFAVETSQIIANEDGVYTIRYI